MSENKSPDPSSDETQADPTRVQPGRPLPREADQAPPNLPGFEIVRELGRGGMGQVFLARQTEPVEREVAVKVILNQIRSADLEWRFQAERQAIAQMQHPAIAQIYEAGTNPDGYPYFAMEYVPGESLLAFCNEHKLGLKERLELFIRICQGVSHAHQKGMVHRDLKPANILVSWVDELATPKIIDFGIATAAGGNQSARDSSSAGTPAYMSPEQFNDPASVDTRSDIHALGVILCELLTDQRPRDQALFRSTDPSQIGSRLTESEPHSPSELLSALGDKASQVAATRRVSSARLARKLVGDLDAIVLRSVAADREQRYASAAELVDEVRNYLAGKPVRAMGEEKGYRFRRFVTRHAWVVTSISLIFLALSIGLGTATTGMNQAQREREQVLARQLELEKLIEFQQLMLGNIEPGPIGSFFVEGLRDQYLQSLGQQLDDETAKASLEAFDVAVGQLRPTDLAQNIVQAFILAPAIEMIERDLVDQPELQARLLGAVYDVHKGAGMFEQSVALARRIVSLKQGLYGPDATETLEARRQLYLALNDSGSFRSARVELDEILARLDPMDADQRSLRLHTWDSLANNLVALGELEDALVIANRNIEMAEREVGRYAEETILAINTLGYVYSRMGEAEAALPYYEESLARAREHFPPTRSVYYSAKLNVAATLGRLGRYQEALELDREVYELLSTHLGRRNLSTLRVANNLAMSLMDTDQDDEALALMNEVVELGRETFGRNHPLTLSLQANRANLYKKMGDLDLALEAYENVALWRERVLAPDHPDTLSAYGRLIDVYLARQDLDQAIAKAELIFERQSASDAELDRVVSSARRIADIQQQAGNVDEEMVWRQFVFDGLRAADRLNEAGTLIEGVRLLELARQMGREPEAEALNRVIVRELDRGGAEYAEVRRLYSQIMSREPQ